MVQELHAADSTGTETRNHIFEVVLTFLDQRNTTAIENTVYTCECSGRANTTTILHKQREAPFLSKKPPSNKPLKKSYLKGLVDTYAVFCTTNQIPFDRPKIRFEKSAQIILATEQVKKIISASFSKYSTIFIIMAETAVEGQELRQTPYEDIDVEQGVLKITGKKGHNNGVYKLKSRTANNCDPKQNLHLKKRYPQPYLKIV